MSSPKVSRNSQLRERRLRHHTSQRDLAREFRVSRARIRQILADTGGDPVRLERVAALARATADDLEWEKRRLKERIGTDLRRLMAVEDELEVRRTDELLGLTN